MGDDLQDVKGQGSLPKSHSGLKQPFSKTKDVYKDIFLPNENKIEIRNESDW